MSVHKKNFYISYLRGFAIIAVILVHLINWAELPISEGQLGFYLRDMLHVGLLFFITLSGSLIVIAYSRYENLKKPTIRLLKRSVLLLLIYFTYTLIKWKIYDFSREPFFLQFIEKGSWNLKDFFTFQAFSVPITVLILWSEFLLITPLILFIIKKSHFKKAIILSLIGFFIVLNYFTVIPRNSFTEVLYGENNVLFSFNLWFLPYLIGLYVGLLGFEKKKKELIIFFGITTLMFLLIHLKDNLPFLLDPYMYPLKPYYISVSFLVMFVLVHFLQLLEKFHSNLIHNILTGLRFIGDNTLFIFISHWVIIDIILAIVPSDKKYFIWPAVFSFFVIYLLFNKKNLFKYKQEFYIKLDKIEN